MTPAAFTNDHYAFILASALEAGYDFIPFDRMAEKSRSDDLVCALRHDCDNDLAAAISMARLEAGLGVRSTYFVMLRSAMYNLLSPPQAELVRAILALGHHLGFHFDFSGSGHMDADEIARRCDQERAVVEVEFGRSIGVVSFHQPTAIVLDNRVKLNCLNTYSREDTQGFHYISDSNMIWREGCPSRMFQEKRHRCLHLLIHPEWWTPTPMPIIDKWKRIVTNNFETVETGLLTRERSYVTPLHIDFRP